MFCPNTIQPHISVYSVFCRVNANYATHATKQRTGLYSGISCDCTHSIAHDTRLVQQAIALPVPRWSACQRPDALNRYQIPPPHRDAVQVSAAAYYNKVYKRADRASPAESRRFPRPAAGDLAPGQWSGRAVWHPPPGGAVQQQGHSGRRGTIGGSRRISFRAVAR